MFAPRSPVRLLSGTVLAASCLAVCTAALGADDPQPASRGGEPVIKRTVEEDDNVRVEELRVRGQTQRVVVQPKSGVGRPYEIVTGATGRDTGGAGEGRRGAEGQRVWSVLGF